MKAQLPMEMQTLAPKLTFDEIDRQQKEWNRRALAVQRQAARAFARLLTIAERGETGQERRVACFVASCFNGHDYPYDLFDLRTFDVDISDDMLVCLDALRWAKADLHTLVPDGAARVVKVCMSHGIAAGSAQG